MDIYRPVQGVQHVDDFHRTAARRNFRESNDVTEVDRDAVKLLGLDLDVLDLHLLLFGVDIAIFGLDFLLFGLDLAVHDFHFDLLMPDLSFLNMTWTTYPCIF